MDRRHLLHATAAAPLLGLAPWTLISAAARPAARVRPGDPAWPVEADWTRLREQVGGRLVKVSSPLSACLHAPAQPSCAALLESLKNPYFLGDEVALTQSLGWVDAWTSMPSVYAVAARSTSDIVAAVNFARSHNLRLVVKGGGHSYQGTSNAPDSLLIWTRKMNAITLHDAFVGVGCSDAPQPAVTIEAGAMWAQAYDAVTTKGGRYVQGGGCLTVGVAGLIQSGGFGSFSKAYGTAAASLIEAEIVTADGAVRTANACTNPELYWALKGGGGGSFGVVTRMTLRTHDLPRKFGPVNMTIRATSPAAFRRLIGKIVTFCGEALMTPHWGEQIRMRPDNLLRISMVFQGLSRGEALAVWQPFIDDVSASPRDFRFESPPLILAVDARTFWAPTMMKKLLGFIRSDDRPGAAATNVFWPGDQSDAAQMLHGYDSAWLPAALLQPQRREAFCDALFAATRHWGFSLHLNKGLAGAPAAALAAARDTATNPAVLDAFALLICGSEEQLAYPGLLGHEPDVPAARRHAKAIANCMNALRPLLPGPAAYVCESNFFQPDWQRAFWGPNYPRLLAVKQRVDPEGLFFVHHGVGSERWSAEGFTRADS